MKIWRGNADDVLDQREKDNILFGVSIGRRAPMHRIHADCLREIAQAGMAPVVVIGSTNGADSHLYDPVRNPMTVVQQVEQLRRAVPECFDPSIVVVLEDVGSNDQWMADLVAELEKAGIPVERSAIHFRAKAADAIKSGGEIKPLAAYMTGFADQGFTVWESFNADPQDDHVNASDIRRFDLNALTLSQRAVMCAPDYIVSLAKCARADNPDAMFLENSGVPLTVFDLTLDRLRKEAGISTREVLALAASTSFDDMGAAALQLHREKCLSSRAVSNDNKSAVFKRSVRP